MLICACRADMLVCEPSGLETSLCVCKQHARKNVNKLLAVRIFVTFGEYFLTFLYVQIKNVSYKSCGEFGAEYDKK